jgi:hypothetical protein
MNRIKIENFKVFYSINDLPISLYSKIDSFLSENGYLTIEEYSFHVNNHKEEVYIFCGWTNNFEIQFFTVLQKKKLRINGLEYISLSSFLYEYFDYLPLLCLVDFNLVKILILNCFPNEKIQLIALQNTLSEVRGFKYFKTEQINIYDSRQENYSELLNKKSIKRKHKDLCKEYEVETLTINANSNLYGYYIDVIEKIHIERWGFNGVSSSFINDVYRKEFYQYPGNSRIINVIINKQNDEIISIHFGFILQNSLLWHSPLINVKYYEYTPLEILLKAVLEYCDNNEIEIFDFGLGSEEYKNRFTNSSKTVYNYYKPLTLSSQVKFLILFKNIDFIKNIISKIKSNIKRSYVFMKKYRAILFFASNNVQESVVRSNYFISAKNWKEFYDLIRSTNLSPSIEDYYRFKKGDVFYCLKIKNEIVCYGWHAKPNDFYVSEINSKISFECDLLMYDFNTPKIHRKKGFYIELLSNICLENKNLVLGIFTDKQNKISISGIKRSGFNFVKKYNGM